MVTSRISPNTDSASFQAAEDTAGVPHEFHHPITRANQGWRVSREFVAVNLTLRGREFECKTCSCGMSCTA